MGLQFFLQVQKIHKSPRKGYYYETTTSGAYSYMKAYIEYDNANSRYHVQLKFHCDSTAWFHYALAFSLFGQTPDVILPSVKSGYSTYYENIQYGGSESSWGSKGMHAQNSTGSSNRLYDFTTDLYFNHTYTTNITWALYSEGARGTNFRLSTADGTMNVPPKPYSAPSIWLNSNDYTKIGVVGKTSYNVHYSLYSGTNGLQWTRSQLFNYDSKSHIWYQQHSRTSSSDGYWDSYVLPTSKFSHGSRYRLAISTYDGTTEVWSPNNPASGGNGYTIYTYQEPKINTSISRYNNSKC